jgi:hypothetical protein
MSDADEEMKQLKIILKDLIEKDEKVRLSLEVKINDLEPFPFFKRDIMIPVCELLDLITSHSPPQHSRE